ncbi:MAG: alpha/beta fold hydrolase, partial [Gaiellales bacterium]
LKPVLELLFADPGLVTRQLVQDVLNYKRLDGAQEALRAIAASVFPEGRQAEDLVPRLGELDAPILVLWGRDDRVIPVAHAEALVGRAQVEVLAGPGHVPHLEAASEVNGLVDRFLAAVD